MEKIAQVIMESKKILEGPEDCQTMLHKSSRHIQFIKWHTYLLQLLYYSVMNPSFPRIGTCDPETWCHTNSLLWSMHDFLATLVDQTSIPDHLRIRPRNGRFWWPFLLLQEDSHEYHRAKIRWPIMTAKEKISKVFVDTIFVCRNIYKMALSRVVGPFFTPIKSGESSSSLLVTCPHYFEALPHIRPYFLKHRHLILNKMPICFKKPCKLTR